MATGYEGGFTRRQELTCTETEMAAYADVVLYENEHIYIKMNSGMIRLKIGDGKTGLLNLPWAKVFDATLDDVEAIVGGFASRVETNTKRIENLEAAVSPEIVTPVTDSTVAYAKTVPKGALPNAAVCEIGGMSYVKNGAILDSKVTAVESVGVNKFSGIDGVDFSKSISVGSLSDKKIKCDFKANTRYRFSWTSTCISTQGTDHVLYLIVNYTDGTVDNWSNLIARAADNKARKIIITTEGKTVSTMEFVYSAEGEFLFEDISLTEYTGADIPYSPYFRNTFPIPEAVQNLDGYGQGVNAQYHNKIVLDPAEGVKKFMKNVGCVDLGTLSWELNNNNVFQSKTLGMIGYNLLCAKYPFVGIVTGNTDAYSKGDKTLSIYTNDRRIYIRDDSYTDAATFKTAMSGVMLVYELATPEETDISAYFTDDNRIPVEAGGTITAVNEFEHEVPFTVKYMIKGA